MRLWRMPHTVAGQLLIALLGGVLIVGPSGCANNFSVGDLASSFGVFLNTDVASGILGAIRLASGESAFVFGSHKADGQIEEITGAVLVDAQDRRADVSFEHGRLKHASSFDGSTLDVTYDEVTSTRLAGRVDLFFAQAPAADQNQSVAFDVDLEQAAAELAATVWNLLTLSISDAEPPDDPLAGKPRLDDAGLHKDDASQVVLFAAFHVSAFAAIGYAMVQIVTGCVRAVMNLVVGLVSAITKTVVFAVFTPFMVLGDVLRSAVINPIITLNFDLDFNFGVPDAP